MKDIGGIKMNGSTIYYDTYVHVGVDALGDPRVTVVGVTMEDGSRGEMTHMTRDLAIRLRDQLDAALKGLTT